MDFSNLKEFMDHAVRTWMPGNAAVVYRNGEKVFEYACGVSSFETGARLIGDENYFLYSTSKITTVTAGVQLLEKGKFLLSDPISEYLPEFREMVIRQPDGNLVPAKNPITVRDLFAMTSGLDYDRKRSCYAIAKERTDGKMDTRAVVRELAKEPLCFEPGTRWLYSMSHDVLAALVEVVSGMKFRDYVQQSIFDPLDMTGCSYHMTDAQRGRMAQQYAFEQKLPEGADAASRIPAMNGDGYFRNVGIRNDLVFGEEYDSGGAGVISDCGSYAKLTAALANGGVGVTGERVLSPAGIELMRTDVLTGKTLEDYAAPIHRRGFGYGLGVRVHTDRALSGSVAPLGTFGWDGAAGACAFISPETGMSIFYVRHTLNPRNNIVLPRLRNAFFSAL